MLCHLCVDKCLASFKKQQHQVNAAKEVYEKYKQTERQPAQSLTAPAMMSNVEERATVTSAGSVYPAFGLSSFWMAKRKKINPFAKQPHCPTDNAQARSAGCKLYLPQTERSAFVVAAFAYCCSQESRLRRRHRPRQPRAIFCSN